MTWYLKSCPVCGGDLKTDEEDPGWVSCFMCGRSFRSAEVRLQHDGDRPKADFAINHAGSNVYEPD